MIMKKLYCFFKVMISYLWDGDLYILVDEDGVLMYGDIYEIIKFMDFLGDSFVLIDLNIYIL